MKRRYVTKKTEERERLQHNFEKYYSSLDKDHKYIVCEVLHLMKYPHKKFKQNLIAYDIINKEMKKQGIDKDELYKQVNEKEPTISKNTFYTCMKNKYTGGDVFPVICAVLNIQKKSFTSFLVQAMYKVNVSWYFNALSRQDKIAISRLAYLLKMSRSDKECFSSLVDASPEINPVKIDMINPLI